MDEHTKLPRTKKLVLFADDDAATRRLFGSKLATAGFEIIYANDGNEGVEMARRFQPDLIVTDIDMPNKDGIEAAYILKADELTKHIYIIFLTNADLSIDGEEAIKAFENAEYMQKGVDLVTFIERIHEVVGKNINSC